jgi:hypothetical protein
MCPNVSNSRLGAQGPLSPCPHVFSSALTAAGAAERLVGHSVTLLLHACRTSAASVWWLTSGVAMGACWRTSWTHTQVRVLPPSPPAVDGGFWCLVLLSLTDFLVPSAAVPAGGHHGHISRFAFKHIIACVCGLLACGCCFVSLCVITKSVS